MREGSGFHLDAPLFPAGDHAVCITLTVEELPTVSMAVTANVLVPFDDVLMRLPLATSPYSDVIPAPPSLQA